MHLVSQNNIRDTTSGKLTLYRSQHEKGFHSLLITFHRFKRGRIKSKWQKRRIARTAINVQMDGISLAKKVVQGLIYFKFNVLDRVNPSPSLNVHFISRFFKSDSKNISKLTFFFPYLWNEVTQEHSGMGSLQKRYKSASRVYSKD